MGGMVGHKPLVFGPAFLQAAGMLKRCLFLPGLALASAAYSQVAPAQLQLADLQEDVRGLTQRVNDLSLQVEELDREKSDLQSQAGAAAKSCATVAQLNQAIADLNHTIESAVASSRDETLRRVGDQMEKLARQTNAALDSLAKNLPPRPGAPLAAAEDRPAQGGNYTVQRGDTLASISKKTGVKIPDIIEANTITDPSRILVGQTLSIPSPGGK
jgi:predicted RNase H-like nuclease (RuvC/YqgF family)